ncbi:hypothetical protein [Aliarcobacter cryaerophilus]|uniref:hypothetical protein n=1 Tax=Aliarcobacter cryaerophilus TaxID=28198 RepID=UPI003DA6A6A8
MKKIIITTYHFYPEINPRAFRAFELAKSLAKNNCEVEIVIPDIDYNFIDIEEKYGFKINKIKPGFLLNSSIKTIDYHKENNHKKSLFFKLGKFLLSGIYLGGKSFEYAFTLYSYLKNMNKNFDAIISISFPISVHIGTSLYLRRLKKNVVSIADTGDPFSNNPESKNYFYFKLIERNIFKYFDYITIPIDSAKKAYEGLVDEKKLKVIPQSIDFSEIRIKNYKSNDVVTFGFAGIFYEKIRNPKVLFDFLATLKMDFRFILYTDTTSPLNMKLIDKYRDILKEKLVINSLITREKCIYELSGMDFVINQNNINAEQKTSKLIDYMITGRPIFEFTQDSFDGNEFLKFLKEPNKNIDKIKNMYIKELVKYDAKNVTNSFLGLIK